MKRLVAVFILLTVLIVLSFGGKAFVKETRDELIELADKAKEAALSNDAKELLKYAEKMSAFFEDRHSVLSLYVRHDELEKLSAQLLSLLKQAELEDMDIGLTLAQIVFTADHIYERELFSIDNLF